MKDNPSCSTHTANRFTRNIALIDEDGHRRFPNLALMKLSAWHTNSLGQDIFGNLTRIDNILRDIPQEENYYRNNLAETRAQAEKAEIEAKAPFSREQELAEKTERLADLRMALQVEQVEMVLMEDDAPDEGEENAPAPSGRVSSAEQRRKSDLSL